MADPKFYKYKEAPRPKPGGDRTSPSGFMQPGVNPIDWYVREGHVKTSFPHSFPFVPGWDVSGIVEEVGAGVTQFKPADEVYSVPDPLRDGAYAEYITVRESEVALKPKSLHHVHAAAVPLAALTAWQTLFDTGETGTRPTCPDPRRLRAVLVTSPCSSRNRKAPT